MAAQASESALAARLPEGTERSSLSHAETKVLCLVRELWRCLDWLEEWLAEVLSPAAGCRPCLSSPVRLVWAQALGGCHTRPTSLEEVGKLASLEAFTQKGAA